MKAEIRGTIDNERADRIIHHLAECHRELRDEPGLDAWDEGELGRYIDAAKDAMNRRRDVNDSRDSDG